MDTKLTKSDIYILAYICFLTAYIMSASQAISAYPILWKVRSFLRMIGYLCCMYNFINLKLNRMKVIWLAWVCSLVFISRYITGIDILVIDFILVATAQDVNIKQLFKVDLFVRFACFIILFLTVKTGVVQDYIGYRDGLLIRQSLGFNHPNRLGVHLLAISLDIFFLNHGVFKIKHWIEILILAFIVNYAADSRTSFLCILMVLTAELFYVVIRKVKVKKKKIQLMIYSQTLLILCIGISFLLPYYYNVGKLYVSGGSNTIGSRIIKAAYALKTNGIHFFGMKITNVTIAEAIEKGIVATGIDNMYVHIIENFGLAFFITIMSLCMYTIYYLVKTKQYNALVCFVIFSIFATVENTATNVECNLFMIFIGQAILRRKNKRIVSRCPMYTKIRMAE